MTGLQMPKVQKSIISNRDKIISDIRKIIRKENVLSHEDEIRPYETDALTAYRQMPLLVALPETVEELKQRPEAFNLLNIYSSLSNQSINETVSPTYLIPKPNKTFSKGIFLDI